MLMGVVVDTDIDWHKKFKEYRALFLAASGAGNERHKENPCYACGFVRAPCKGMACYSRSQHVSPA